MPTIKYTYRRHAAETLVLNPSGAMRGPVRWLVWRGFWPGASNAIQPGRVECGCRGGSRRLGHKSMQDVVGTWSHTRPFQLIAGSGLAFDQLTYTGGSEPTPLQADSDDHSANEHAAPILAIRPKIPHLPNLSLSFSNGRLIAALWNTYSLILGAPGPRLGLSSRPLLWHGSHRLQVLYIAQVRSCG